MLSSVDCQMLCTALISLMMQFVAGCETRYTKKPLYEHRCVSTSEVAVSKTDRHKCQWQCVQQNCSYINHNPSSDQCEIGLGQCESLAPAVGVLVNIFWQPRDVCLHWAPTRNRDGWLSEEAAINLRVEPRLERP